MLCCFVCEFVYFLRLLADCMYVVLMCEIEWCEFVMSLPFLPPFMASQPTVEKKPMAAVTFYGFAIAGRLREAFDINFGVIENENKNKKIKND